MLRFLAIAVVLQGCSATQSPPNPEVFAGGIDSKNIKKYQSEDYKPEDETSDDEAWRSLQLQMEECEKRGFYYDLAAYSCDDERKLANIECTREHITDKETTGFLSDNQKAEVQNLFNNELQNYKLRFCIDDIEHYTIVAIRTATDSGIKFDVVELEVTR